MLCIIPARGGSKGIPDKNIIDINGYPLIFYTIKPALEAQTEGLIDKVIVSTDSQKIADIANKLGAEIPFLRPENISGDKAKSVDLIKHALDFYNSQNKKYKNVILLQPTSPLRDFNDLKNCINLYNNSQNDSLITAYEEEYINDLVMYKVGLDGKTSEPLNNKHNKVIRRQDHGSTYVRNGCIYISDSELINNGYVIGEKPLMYIMPKSKSINLDSMEDLNIFRNILK